MPTRAANANYSMHVWEVDDKARVTSMLELPHAHDSLKAEGGYRTVPVATLQGESAEPPSAFKHVAGSPWSSSDDDDDDDAGASSDLTT